MNQEEHAIASNWRSFLTASITASAFALVLLVAPSYAQTVPAAQPHVSVISPLSAKLDAAAKDKAVRPFHINIPEEVFADLRRRIAAMKWPEGESVSDATQGPIPAAVSAYRMRSIPPRGAGQKRRIPS